MLWEKEELVTNCRPVKALVCLGKDKIGFLSGCFNLLQQQHCRLDKIERICRRQLNVARMMISLIDRAENTVRKGENAGYQHFSFSTVFFKKPYAFWSL